MNNSNFIHDLINPDTGKTYKEENLEKKHEIPIDSLVELDDGVRLFVFAYTRDCDGTPLYRLAVDKSTVPNPIIAGNYSEKSFIVVR